MLTIFFIILKVTDQIFLNWWWIMIFLILDISLSNQFRKLYSKIEDLEDRLCEIEGNKLFSSDDEDEDYI